MARRAATKSIRRPEPATTAEGRENQLISAAMNLAEKQLLDGTASSQVIAHFLKMGSQREKLERLKMEREIEMLSAKTESLQSNKHLEELYEDAKRAMLSYQGTRVE